MSGPDLYEDLSDEIHYAVQRAACSFEHYPLPGGHTWIDSDPPALILHFHDDQPMWLRQEMARRVLDELHGVGLVAEHPDLVTTPDNPANHLASGGWMAVRRA